MVQLRCSTRCCSLLKVCVNVTCWMMLVGFSGMHSHAHTLFRWNRNTGSAWLDSCAKNQQVPAALNDYLLTYAIQSSMQQLLLLHLYQGPLLHVHNYNYLRLYCKKVAAAHVGMSSCGPYSIAQLQMYNNMQVLCSSQCRCTRVECASRLGCVYCSLLGPGVFGMCGVCIVGFLSITIVTEWQGVSTYSDTGSLGRPTFCALVPFVPINDVHSTPRLSRTGDCSKHLQLPMGTIACGGGGRGGGGGGYVEEWLEVGGGERWWEREKWLGCWRRW